MNCPFQLWLGRFHSTEHFNAYIFGSAYSYDPAAVSDAPDLLVPEGDDADMSRFSSDNNASYHNIEMLDFAFRQEVAGDPRSLLDALHIESDVADNILFIWKEVHESAEVNAGIIMRAEGFQMPASKLSTSYRLYYVGSFFEFVADTKSASLGG